MTKTYEIPSNREEVKKYIPHRYTMLFVDRVTSVEDNKITVESDIDPAAEFLKGHFPGRPIVPGVFIIETVAQAGALLVSLTRGLEDDKFLAFTHVDDAKFRKPVYPNETISVDVEIEKIRGPFYKFRGRASVDNQVVATLRFAAAQMDFDQDT